MSSRRSHTWQLAIAAAVAAVTLAAGCSSGSHKDGGGSGGSSAKGTVTIESWNSLANAAVAVPESKTAMQAAIKAINSAGGINGHQVKLIFCDSNFDPNTEVACAREAVSKKVAAVVGAASYFPNTAAVLEAGKVPLVGARGADPTDFTSSISYPMVAGTFGWANGMAALAKQLGLQKVSIVSSAAPTSSQQTDIAKARLNDLGIQVGKVISAPTGAADQTATAAAAADGVDGILADAPPNDTLKVLQSLKQSGYRGAFISPSPTTPPNSLKALGTVPFKQYAISLTVPPNQTSDPTIAAFGKEMDAVDTQAQKSETALTFWTAMKLFAAACSKLDTINASTVTSAMNSLAPVQLGSTAPYAVAGVTSPVQAAPRLFNPMVMYLQMKDGVPTPLDGKFVSPFPSAG
jgi:ABC-type branched-subunit amino acid transport system substrate-binding protein